MTCSRASSWVVLALLAGCVTEPDPRAPVGARSPPGTSMPPTLVDEAPPAPPPPPRFGRY